MNQNKHERINKELKLNMNELKLTNNHKTGSSIDLMVIKPSNFQTNSAEILKVILFFHGGGFVMGSPEEYLPNLV